MTVIDPANAVMYATTYDHLNPVKVDVKSACAASNGVFYLPLSSRDDIPELLPSSAVDAGTDKYAPGQSLRGRTVACPVRATRTRSPGYQLDSPRFREVTRPPSSSSNSSSWSWP